MSPEFKKPLTNLEIEPRVVVNQEADMFKEILPAAQEMLEDLAEHTENLMLQFVDGQWRIDFLDTEPHTIEDPDLETVLRLATRKMVEP